LCEFSVILEKETPFLGAFSSAPALEKVEILNSELQVSYFWGPKVPQMDAKSHAVGTQVWDF